MTVLLVLLMFGTAITIDYFKTRKSEGTVYYSPAIGWAAADGGKKIKK